MNFPCASCAITNIAHLENPFNPAHTHLLMLFFYGFFVKIVAFSSIKSVVFARKRGLVSDPNDLLTKITIGSHSPISL
jgi:hypothetical protein